MLLLVVFGVGCSFVQSNLTDQETDMSLGVASFYGPHFHGRLTANGERFNQYDNTAAHRHWPFNTKVKVTNMSNGKNACVRINDRGPYISGRIIDVSFGIARRLGFVQQGLARVSLEKNSEECG
jgi:rare lipoprotein A